jgi:transmembrane sensor
MKDGRPKSPDSARDQAIEWWLRQNDGPLSKRERAAFDEWLAADEANKVAFEKLSRIGGLIEARHFGRKQRRKARRSRAKVAAAGIAGAVALVVLYDDVSIFLRSDYRTGTAETRRIMLEDGSEVELAPTSAIAVHYEPGRRCLVLLRGEAWFEASPDAARPFVVTAAEGTVTALGTAFDVALEQDFAQVTVTKHQVKVTSGGIDTLVAEGQQTSFTLGGPASLPEPADVAQATAWRRGKLIFANKPLGEVVEALGRYHTGTVVFTNKALRMRPVSGVFKADDPRAAFDEIETSLGLHTARLTDYLVVIYD